MNIVDIVNLKYPGSVERGLVTFVQHSIEEGIQISSWNVEGVEKPSESELIEEAHLYQSEFERNNLKIRVSRLIQKVLDDKAKEKDYDNEINIATYINSTNAIWKKESEDFLKWRDSVWEYAQSVLSGIENGDIEPPSEAEFIADIPPFTWGQ